MALTVERVARFAERHERAIGIVGALWFALSCADSAGAIDLPKIPGLTGVTGVVVAALANGLWYGFLYPALERRKAAAKAIASAGPDRSD